MTLREKLVRVRDIMRERGTRTGSLGLPGGPVCLVGAVAEVEGLCRPEFDTWTGEAYKRLQYPGDQNAVIQALSRGLPKRAQHDAAVKQIGPEPALFNYHDTHAKAASVAVVTRAIKALDAEADASS